MQNRKFYVGEKVRGLSNRYSITCAGWIGIVTRQLPYDKIMVRGIGRDSEYDVDENCFESVEPREPMRNEEGKAICDHCGEVIEDESEIIWTHGKAICKSCAEKDFVQCETCGDIIPENEAITIDGEMACPSCAIDGDEFFTCCECGVMHRRRLDNYVYLTGEGKLCNDCRDSGRYEMCPDCGRWFRAGDLVPSRRDGIRRCSDCERALKAKAIKEYHYKPNPIFKVHNHTDFMSDKGIKELLFGVELEIDKGTDREDCAAELLGTSADIYCKRDGSLRNGIEIVTHPCTLEYHRKDLGWDKIAKIALDYNFRSQEAQTCGLHVHVGRWQMGKNNKERKETAAKIVLLVDRHWDSLVKFSRRKSEALGHWAARPNINFEDVNYGDYAVEQAALLTREDGRYQAVNLENGNTVEFRLFNGTLRVPTIFATLELVSNMVKFARDKSVEEVMNSEWTDIIKGNIIDEAENSELMEYLEMRGLLEGETPTYRDWKAKTYEPPEMFEIGDKVIIDNANGASVQALTEHIGETATIVRVYEDSFDRIVRNHNYLVDFGHEGVGLHTNGGEMPTATCYNVYHSNLRRVEEEE